MTPPLGTQGGGPLVDDIKLVEVCLIEVEAKTKNEGQNKKKGKEANFSNTRSLQV